MSTVRFGSSQRSKILGTEKIEILIFDIMYPVPTMFLHSVGMPRAPETTLFQCFGGPERRLEGGAVEDEVEGRMRW